MNRYLYILLFSMLTVAESEAQQVKNGAPPRLVVNIIVDQLRSDYLEAFMPLYGPNGFRKLMGEGCVFVNATYPFAPLDRASAVSCLSTGATPSMNGIPSSEWLSRKTLRTVNCLDDPSAPYTVLSNGSSPINMLSSTLGDELKIATTGTAKVYSVATEQDAAILLAGHKGDMALWISNETGRWGTSSYYSKTPAMWLDQYNRQQSPAFRIQQSAEWRPVSGGVTTFRYFQTPTVYKPFAYSFYGNGRYKDYVTSGLVNHDVTSMALQCVSSARMGTDETTDLLQLQYYAGTYRSQGVEKQPMEMADTYARLDQSLEKLITSLEQSIGKDRVLFVLSSTGYFNEECIDYTQHSIPAGTVYVNRTANLLNMYLSATYGQARYVQGFHDNHIYLDHKLIEQKRLKLNEVLEHSREMLLLSSGISSVYTSLQLLGSPDPALKPLRNGYNIAVSGDIVFDVQPGWKLLNEDTNRQQQWRIQGLAFPIIVYGAGVAHEAVNTPVTVPQITSTIAKSIHIRAPNACKSVPLR